MPCGRANQGGTLGMLLGLLNSILMLSPQDRKSSSLQIPSQCVWMYVWSSSDLWEALGSCILFDLSIELAIVPKPCSHFLTRLTSKGK